MLLRKVKNTVENRQADSPLAQARFSKAYGLVATARLHWREAVGIVSSSLGHRPSALPEDERAKYPLSLALSGRQRKKLSGSSSPAPEGVPTGFLIPCSGSSAT
jgi:hypothetical protein